MLDHRPRVDLKARMAHPMCWFSKERISVSENLRYRDITGILWILLCKNRKQCNGLEFIERVDEPPFVFGLAKP